MKELPEPDGYYFREDLMYIGGGEDIKTGDYRPDTVLAIQKQAYEDGLRDAGKDAERYQWLKEYYSPETNSRYMTSVDRGFLGEDLDAAIDAEIMLTASQKEPQ